MLLPLHLRGMSVSAQPYGRSEIKHSKSFVTDSTSSPMVEPVETPGFGQDATSFSSDRFKIEPMPCISLFSTCFSLSLPVESDITWSEMLCARVGSGHRPLCLCRRCRQARQRYQPARSSRRNQLLEVRSSFDCFQASSFRHDEDVDDAEISLLHAIAACEP